jgi:Na+-translocating ferredoxin:NAD+ oxidoreductase RnfC subunit
MSTKKTIIRVSATYPLRVEVGDRVRRGEKINEGPETDPTSRAPVSGMVKSIQFDPGGHEFVIVIAPAD